MHLNGSILDSLTNASDVVKVLFEGDARRLSKVLEEIIDSNERAYKLRTTAGFIFNGDFYHRAGYAVPRHGERHPLHESLWDTMMEYLQDVGQIVRDMTMINQMVHRLLADCVTAQDVRDALPESLAQLSNTLSALPRTRQVAWTLENDNRALRQFEKIRPLMDVYATTRLIF